MKIQTTCLSCLILLLSFLFFSCGDEKQVVYDIVIYGDTFGGIITVFLAKRMKKSVFLIESGSRIGGLNTGGLDQTDIGNKSVNEGISCKFYKGIKKYYEDPQNWK